MHERDRRTPDSPHARVGRPGDTLYVIAIGCVTNVATAPVAARHAGLRPGAWCHRRLSLPPVHPQPPLGVPRHKQPLRALMGVLECNQRSLAAEPCIGAEFHRADASAGGRPPLVPGGGPPPDTRSPRRGARRHLPRFLSEAGTSPQLNWRLRHPQCKAGPRTASSARTDACRTAGPGAAPGVGPRADFQQAA